MGLEDLLRTMERDAARELADAVAQDEAQAAAILLAARDEGNRLRRSRLDEVRAETKRESDLRTAAARSRRHNEDRAALEERLGQVQADAQRALRSLREGEAAVAPTLALLEEALTALPSATVAHVGPASADQAARLLEEGWPHVQLETDLEDVGAVVTDEAGRRLDNTTSTRLGNDWPDARVAVAGLWVTS